MKNKILIPIFISFLTFTGTVQAFLDQKTITLGQPVEDFELTDTAGNPFKLSEHRGKIVVFHFWSAQCPFVVRYEERLQNLTKDFSDKGVEVLGIASNKTESADKIKTVAEERRVNYPILLDPDQSIANKFGAITTPHVFIVDKEGHLVYEGSVDDQGWKDDNPITKSYARDAVEALLSGSPVPVSHTSTFGCSVKR